MHHRRHRYTRCCDVARTRSRAGCWHGGNGGVGGHSEGAAGRGQSEGKENGQQRKIKVKTRTTGDTATATRHDSRPQKKGAPGMYILGSQESVWHARGRVGRSRSIRVEWGWKKSHDAWNVVEGTGQGSASQRVAAHVGPRTRE